MYSNEILVKSTNNLGPEVSIEDYPDLETYIAASIDTLRQLGVVKKEFKFNIEDDTQKVSDMLYDTECIGIVEAYLIAKVTIRFDPPQTSYLVDLLKQSINEYEFRLQEQYDKYLPTQVIITTGGYPYE